MIAIMKIERAIRSKDASRLIGDGITKCPVWKGSILTNVKNNTIIKTATIKFSSFIRIISIANLIKT
jgi:hypothetical protein